MTEWLTEITESSASTALAYLPLHNALHTLWASPRALKESVLDRTLLSRELISEFVAEWNNISEFKCTCVYNKIKDQRHHRLKWFHLGQLVLVPALSRPLGSSGTKPFAPHQTAWKPRGVSKWVRFKVNRQERDFFTVNRQHTSLCSSLTFQAG